MDINYLSLMLEMRPLVNALKEDEIENDGMRSLDFCKELEAVLGDACNLDFFYFDKCFFFRLYGSDDNEIAVSYITKLNGPEQDRSTAVYFKKFDLWFTVKDFNNKMKLKEMIERQLEKPERDSFVFSAQEMVSILKEVINDTCLTFPDDQEFQTMFMKLMKGCKR